MFYFLDQVLQEQRADGSAALERGDWVIMDNCGFHHGHRVGPVRRAMLADCGVRLLFQPPYSPQFNTCEYCSNAKKPFLRCHHTLAPRKGYYHPPSVPCAYFGVIVYGLCDENMNFA